MARFKRGRHEAPRWSRLRFAPLAVVACGAPQHPVASPPSIPEDHRLHTTVTPEAGGSHIQVVGHAVAIEDVAPPGLGVPFVGALDVSVDLHVPRRDGRLDYRGATGQATARCATGCAFAVGALFEGSAAPPPGTPPPIAIDHLDARVVFANGRADLVTWKIDAKDLRFDLTGHLALAPVLADSTASVCLRLGRPSSPIKLDSELAKVLEKEGLAIDANGFMRLELGGRAGALEVRDLGCGGQVRPPALPPADDAPPGAAELDRQIAKRSDTAFDIDASLLERVVANPMRSLGDTRIVPYVRNGKPGGFTVFAIRPASLMARLGFRNGDVLLAVDGHDLATAQEALAVYTSVSRRHAGDALTVTIERGGRPLTLTYTLR